MKKCWLLAFVLLLPVFIFAQDYPLTDSLKAELARATSPSEKIRLLGSLRNFYYGLNRNLSDEYGKEQMKVAEMSRDRELMIKAVLSHADGSYNYGGVQENLNKGKRYSEQALKLAKAEQLDEYIAWAYVYLARGARMNGEKDKALNYDNLAVSIAGSTANDSLKISALHSMGETYLSRKENLLAFRNYIQGLNLAEQIDSYEQIKNSYFYLAEFYLVLEDYEKSKDYLFKLRDLTIKENKPYDRLNVYSFLGGVYTGAKQYDLALDNYEKGIALADTTGFTLFKVNCYSGILNMYLFSRQSETALKYFKEKKELRDFMQVSGVDYIIDYAYGLAYTQMKKFDSAEYFLKKSQIRFETVASKANQYYFYSNIAELYENKNEPKKALDYYLKAKTIAEDRGDIQLLQNISADLDTVYQMMADYKNALVYNKKYHHYKDSLEELSTEKDLLRLEVDNENKRKEKEAVAAAEAKRERHNIQYMGITAGIAAVFIMLVMLGAFSVSKSTIRIIGFFAFIFLFEFIILLADHAIHDATHGEPWKILAIKIMLISILLPLHHFLEKKVIHFLTERKLMEGNAKSLFYKLTGKTETDPAH